MNTGSADLLQWMISGEIDFSIRANSPPASPVKAPAITNAVHWYSWTFSPRKEARWPFSRIDLSVAPKGEERKRRSSSTDSAHDGEHEVVHRLRRADVEGAQAAERDRLYRDPLDPVVAAGQAVPFVGDREDELAEREGQHGEVHPRQPDAEEPDDPGRHARRRPATAAAPAGSPKPALGQEETHRVGADPEERGLAEGEQPRRPQEKVEGDRHQGRDEDLGQQVLVEPAREEGNEQQEDQGDQAHRRVDGEVDRRDLLGLHRAGSCPRAPSP